MERSKPSFQQSSYVVSEGDTFFSVATAFNMTPLELAKLNNVPTTHVIVPGDSLKVQVHLYSVQKDDTLSSVAKLFGTTPQRIAGLNGLGDPETASISPSQVLRIG